MQPLSRSRCTKMEKKKGRHGVYLRASIAGKSVVPQALMGTGNGLLVVEMGGGQGGESRESPGGMQHCLGRGWGIGGGLSWGSDTSQEEKDKQNRGGMRGMNE